MKMKISDIIVEGRMRNVDMAKVAELKRSISIVGLMQPIIVDKNGRLVAGAHRLEACIQLGYEEVDVIVQDYNSKQRAIAEIDENLVRNDLHWLEAGEHIILRDELLKEMGLRAQAGDNQHSNDGADSPPKTTAKLAKEMGTSERTLQENRQIAGNLVKEAKEAVRKLDIQKGLALKISRLKPDEQRKVVAKGDPKEIAEAIGKLKAKKKDGKKKKSDAPTEEADATLKSESTEEAIDGYAETLLAIMEVLDRANGVIALFAKASGLATDEAQRDEVKKLRDTAYSSFSSVTSELKRPGADYAKPAKDGDKPKEARTMQ